MADPHLEPESELSPQARDMHRALVSLVEEIDAVDWYHQRVALTRDESLRRVLAHNADEEKEHAAMLLEWLRRRDSAWDENLRTYLFTTADILEVETEAEGGATGSSVEAAPAGEAASTDADPETRVNAGRWTVGSLKGR